MNPQAVRALSIGLGVQVGETATDIDAMSSTELSIQNPVSGSGTRAMYIDGDGNIRMLTAESGSATAIDAALAEATGEAIDVQKANAANLAQQLMAKFEALSTLAGAETPRGRHFAGFVFDSEAAAQGLLAEHVMEFVRSAPVLQVLHAGADEEPTLVDVGG
jgi:hypothetical protein